ncbi:hypothetical protein Pan1_23 [Pseudanabaena phage Pan1]|nr:hypothetical protein Pan1_23 [Pseudanabaena phage Pan1]
MKNLQTFPVMKNGEFFGYADAEQIAESGGVLELFDENKAESIKAAKAVEEAGKQAEAKKQAVENAKAAGGADAGAVKKGPSA